jgi:hypothetical protein
MLHRKKVQRIWNQNKFKNKGSKKFQNESGKVTQTTNFTEKMCTKLFLFFNCFRIKVSCHLKIKMVRHLVRHDRHNALVSNNTKKVDDRLWVLSVSEDGDPDDNNKKKQLQSLNGHKKFPNALKEDNYEGEAWVLFDLQFNSCWVGISFYFSFMF